MPEGKAHLILRTFLFRLLRFALGPLHSVGSDQFVYWNARDPRRCLAPDVFVRLGVPDALFATWKTWEQGGAPELAIEIVSQTESNGPPWEEKLARYHELGVKELVRFDPTSHEGERIQLWDRMQEDLVERVVERDRAFSLTLGLYWVVSTIEGTPAMRLADAEGRLLESEEEERTREAQRAAAEAERADAAEARVRELEAELRRRA